MRAPETLCYASDVVRLRGWGISTHAERLHAAVQTSSTNPSALYMTPTRLAVLLSIATLTGACSTYTQDLSPAEAGAAVPPATYRSTTADYRPGAEVERPSSWRDLNDQQLRLGGHQGQLGDAPDDDAGLVPQPPTDRRVRRVVMPDASAKPR